jgi:hypothetical protein
MNSKVEEVGAVGMPRLQREMLRKGRHIMVIREMLEV